MADADVPKEAAAATDIARKVEQAQVELLFSMTAGSVIAAATMGGALCICFYWITRDALALVWGAIHFLQLLRYPKVAAYHRDPERVARSAYWARIKWQELTGFSSVWGLAPWFLLPSANLSMTAIVVLIILGLASGGVPAVAPRWSSTLGFLLPMVLGLITALLWRADTEHLFLAFCCAVYLVVTLHFARQQHLMLAQSLQVRFEKESLANALAQQVAITQRISEEKSRLFAAARHDLLQPLHAIRIYGSIIREELADHTAYPHAERLMQMVNAMGVSLESMLNIRHLDGETDAEVRQPFPLNQVLQDISLLFAARADRKGLQLRIRASPLWLVTDSAKLQRILSNLVDNAIKYTDAGGILVVVRQHGEAVWIDVQDTGPGISADQLLHIFDDFYQINPHPEDRTQGLGLGLSIAKRLASQLGLQVFVHSRPGSGSRFRVVLQGAYLPDGNKSGESVK